VIGGNGRAAPVVRGCMSDPDILREYMELCEASNRAAVALGQYHATFRARFGMASDENLLRLEREYEEHQPRIAELHAVLRAETDGSKQP
jgi:hypothetical protein